MLVHLSTNCKKTACNVSYLSKFVLIFLTNVERIINVCKRDFQQKRTNVTNVYDIYNMYRSGHLLFRTDVPKWYPIMSRQRRVQRGPYPFMFSNDRAVCVRSLAASCHGTNHVSWCFELGDERATEGDIGDLTGDGIHG